MTHNFEKLYYYDCLEAAKYPRSGYTMNRTIKAVKEDIKANYIAPVKIHVRLVKVLSEEYAREIKKFKSEG